MNEELLDRALDIFFRMRSDYCDHEDGNCKLLCRWSEYVEEIEDLQRHADRAQEQQANLAAKKNEGVK